MNVQKKVNKYFIEKKKYSFVKNKLWSQNLLSYTLILFLIKTKKVDAIEFVICKNYLKEEIDFIHSRYEIYF